MYKLYIEDDGKGHSGLDIELGVFKEKPSLKKLRKVLNKHMDAIGEEGLKIIKNQGSYQPPTSWNTYVLEKIKISG